MPSGLLYWSNTCPVDCSIDVAHAQWTALLMYDVPSGLLYWCSTCPVDCSIDVAHAQWTALLMYDVPSGLLYWCKGHKTTSGLREKTNRMKEFFIWMMIETAAMYNLFLALIAISGSLNTAQSSMLTWNLSQSFALEKGVTPGGFLCC